MKALLLKVERCFSVCFDCVFFCRRSLFFYQHRILNTPQTSLWKTLGCLSFTSELLKLLRMLKRDETHLYCFHQGLVIRCTLQSLRRAQTGGTRPLLSAAYSTCPQTASCPLKHKHTENINFYCIVFAHKNGKRIIEKIRYLGHRKPIDSWILSNNPKTINNGLYWLHLKTNIRHTLIHKQMTDTDEQMTPLSWFSFKSIKKTHHLPLNRLNHCNEWFSESHQIH